MDESLRGFLSLIALLLALMGLGWVVLLVLIAPRELGGLPPLGIATLVLSVAALYIAIGGILLVIALRRGRRSGCG